MAHADVTFPLTSVSAPIPVLVVGEELPLEIDGDTKTVLIDVTNPKESSARLGIEVSLTGFANDPLASKEIRRPDSGNVIYPANGLTFAAGHTERLSVKLVLNAALPVGYETSLRVVVTEV